MMQVTDANAIPADLLVDVNGNYQPYTYWLNTFGLHDFYDFARERLGDVSGTKLLDAGCGIGNTAVMFAKLGADVSGFDIDDDVLQKANTIAAANHVDVTYDKKYFETIDYPDSHFDFVFGALVIHHVDVTKAAEQLGRVLKPGGKAIFVENSGRNPLLMFMRSRVVGRFGVPKHGDDEEEHPLTDSEIQTMRDHFPGKINLHFPSLVMFRLADLYIFRSRSKIISSMLRGLDQIFGAIPGVKRMSYFQILEFKRDL